MSTPTPELPSQEASTNEASTQVSSQPPRLVRGRTDPAWGHCVEVIESNGTSAKMCTFCKKTFRGGGITRFKQHLAGVVGQVEQCKKVPANVRFQMKQLLDELKKENNKKAPKESGDGSCQPNEDSAGVMNEDLSPTHAATSKKAKTDGRIAREEMERRFKRNKKVVEPYLKIMDKRWDSQLRKKLHAAGYWLNPAYRFDKDEYAKHETTAQALLDVIEKFAYGDDELETKLINEMRLYKDSEGDFGRKLAKKERTTVTPDQWWDTYGLGVPNLRRLAIRVLSQTCSASGCERNWSVFEHIHSKKRNRLEHQKLNDLVFVRYNLRLEQRNRLKDQNYDPINIETIHDHSDWVCEDAPTFLSVEELETFRSELANPSTQVQPLSNELDRLNLDDDEDDAQLDAQVDANNDVNENEDNIGEGPNDLNDGLDDVGWMPEYEETLLPPWG